MKILLPTLLIATSFNVTASELKSKKIKELICTELSKTYVYQVKKKECLENGKFDIKKSKNIDFDNKSYSVEMEIETVLNQSTYLSTVSRSLQAYPFKLGEWNAKITSYNLGTSEILKNTDIDSSNIIELNEYDYKKLPMSVLAFVGDTEWDYAEDYSSEITYFAILDNDVNVIGYMAHQWFESEEEDIKGYTSQNFDLKGNKVGKERYESFSYHE